MPIQPLSDTIIVQLRGSGPSTEVAPGRPRIQHGVALQVGPGYRAGGPASGRVSVRPGDTVFFSEMSGVILSEEDGICLFVSERDVLAIDPSEEEEEVPLFVPRPPKAT